MRKSELARALYSARRTPEEIAHMLKVSRETIIKWLELSTPRKSLIESMKSALIQARGALLIDTMVDDDGKPYGTTQVALEAIESALAKADGVTP